MKRLLVIVMSLLTTPPLEAGGTNNDAAANLRVGESINGFPNWEERVIHQWINRSRVDPQADLARCGASCAESKCYQPVAPLSWDDSLGRAARFHSDEMREQNYIAHDSKCTVVSNINSLYPAGCDGDASCACVGGSPTCSGGTCTPWNVRVGMFGGSPAGEIIAGYSDPNAAFYVWLYESSPTDACGPNGSNLHRWIILQMSGSVGVGVSGYSTADFGGGAAAYKIPSGAHYPRQAESVEVWANWFDAQAPRSASVVVDGKCIPLQLEHGTQQNGAWSATVSNLGTGCHRYYFSFVDSTGRELTYPATGSLGIGDEQCSEWTTSRSSAKCSTPSANPVTPAPSPVSRRRGVRH